MVPQKLMWPQVLSDLLAGGVLTREQTRGVMQQIMSGAADPAQIAGFVVALRARGLVSAEELQALSDIMYDHAVQVKLHLPAVDVVGTGGDGHGTLNISTMAAVVVAASGRPVVKHGSRAATSSSGSSDVLQALGVHLPRTPAQVQENLAEVGMTFCFAPAFHPAMKHVAPVRAALGVPTIFNVLGPLVNPARPVATVLGVADQALAPVMAQVLASRDGARALVVHGSDGLDEVSTAGPTQVWWVRDGSVTELTVDVQDWGIARGSLSDIAGSDPAANARAFTEVLAGQPHPAREAVLANAAVAAAIFDDLNPVSDQSGAQLTGLVAELAAVLDDGRAADLMQRWIQHSATNSDPK